MKALVTGGAGFIGSHLVTSLVLEKGFEVANVDKMTYAADEKNLSAIAHNPKHHLVKKDIVHAAEMQKLMLDFKPDVVFHLAAESHVDRSITSSQDFIHTNILGTHSLLQAALEYQGSGLAPKNFKFIHVSTDEVYGSLGPTDAAFSESTAFAPNSPYSASKAASDHLARAWWKTYQLPVVITHCSNNYGPHQYHEKLIPLMIHHALLGKALPVYGTGANVRDWLYVQDHAQGLIAAWEKGQPGETYNFGGHHEVSNLDLVHQLCEKLDAKKPLPNGSYKNLIQFVQDRKGHDFRYAIETHKAEKELGWKPRVSFQDGLQKTLDWYLGN